ncbi:hypothetical protein CMV_006399 [Castanea mollissima]|uniref:sucrose synthase n=1 Tax=Castanea mollissima TaxID=60419 RepID=A0A8J4RWN7_9ROSI|nr:hypothetical protein CMV_006399 [Castanea mollissima]
MAMKEAIVLPPFVAIAIHPRPGLWEYVHINVFELSVDLLSVAEYLQFKEELVDGQCNDNYFLELDFEPFSATFDQLNHQPLGMGFNSSTVTYLQAMMLNDWIQNISKLQSALARAEEYLSKLPLTKLQGMGFERGWGDIAQRMSETIHLLLEILQASDPSTLETFLGRIPMLFNVVIVSPHGYFSQANILGLPDTGGQIVYILDQVCALEDEMLLRIQKQGLDVIPKILIGSVLIYSRNLKHY